jgi:transcriptional regulator with XRE-family HTH domain
VLDASDTGAQSAFSAAVATLLRESRIRQGMTQAQVSARTGGLVSKAALANYETGHRSLRVDVFWLLVRALGEDAGALLANSERRSGYGRTADAVSALTVDVEAVLENDNPRLAPVRRWFALRLQAFPGRAAVRTVTLDEGALNALASLMAVSQQECRTLLQAAGLGRVEAAAAVAPVMPVASVVGASPVVGASAVVAVAPALGTSTAVGAAPVVAAVVAVEPIGGSSLVEPALDGPVVATV